MRSRKLSYIFFFAVFLFLSNVSASECKLTILHFNDTHGYLTTPKKGLGGGARIANLVANIEAENNIEGRHTILLHGGDLISGTPLSGQYKGEAEFKFLGAIGTEVMVLGNHEFDFGIDSLKKNIKHADFPVLAANIIDKKAERLFTTATYVIPFVNECTIGIVGVVTDKTPSMTGGDTSSLKFYDPVESANQYVDDLEDQADVQIALTHIERERDVQLAEKVPYIDVVVGGHDHVNSEDYCKTVKNIPVCETPANGKYVGRIDLSVKNGKVTIEKTELIPVDKSAGKSKEVAKLLETYLAPIEVLMKETVTTLNHKVGRPELGSIAADSMKQKTGADIAFINSGGLRKDLKKGKVTKGDVYEALPFPNIVGYFNMTGEELLKIVKSSEGRKINNPNSYLAWSGLIYKKTDGAYKVMVGSERLENGKRYKVATVDFLADGGDGYSMLKKMKFNKTDKYIRDVVIEYLQRR